jgi:hypothetical protein
MDLGKPGWDPYDLLPVDLDLPVLDPWKIPWWPSRSKINNRTDNSETST